MDERISVLLMILLAIEDAYIWNILCDIDRISLVIMNELEQRIVIRNDCDHVSEQANDQTDYSADRLPSIDTVIINP